MANEARFLGKNLISAEGIRANDASVIEKGSSGQWNLIGGLQVADGVVIAKISSVLASIDFGAMQPVGSTGGVAADVVLAGVAVGDQCFAAPVQSVPDDLVWAAACYSAGAVNVRVSHIASGNIDLAATNWRVSAIKFG